MMNEIREFIRNGQAQTDAELMSMMRSHLATLPAAEQRNWLFQVELSLDGYGGAAHLAAARRVKVAVHHLQGEVAG